MPEESMNQEFRCENIDKISNYLIKEIYRNDLMNKKHKKVCKVLNYIVHSLIIIISAIT